MKQVSSILLVLSYQYYLGTCQAKLPPETNEPSVNLPPEDNTSADNFKSCGNLTILQNDVIFQLYTRSHPTNYTALKPTEEADIGDFNSQRETKIIIHGWGSTPGSLASIRNGYLEVGDYNVILVDWSKPADTSYSKAMCIMYLVGEYLASLIDLLVTQHSLRLENLHIVGHSLGAQMAGITGNRIKSGIPGRITGLDPAEPFFCEKPLEDRLDTTDAHFVDVMHTCGGILAWRTPVGHVDFFANAGTAVQPGCGHSGEEDEVIGFDLMNIPQPVSCSHHRAHEFFAESITNPSGFVSYKCSSRHRFVHGKCLQNSRALMGEYTDINSRGRYYLLTAESSPYALGNAPIHPESDLKGHPIYWLITYSSVC